MRTNTRLPAVSHGGGDMDLSVRLGAALFPARIWQGSVFTIRVFNLTVSSYQNNLSQRPSFGYAYCLLLSLFPPPLRHDCSFELSAPSSRRCSVTPRSEHKHVPALAQALIHDDNNIPQTQLVPKTAYLRHI
jgi:hypothetical protein